MNLRSFFDASGLSGAEIARRMGHASNGLVSQIIRGERPIPLDKLDAWTNALGLEGDDAAEFRRLALAAQAPALAAEMGSLRARLEVMDRINTNLFRLGWSHHQWMMEAGVPVDTYAKILEGSAAPDVLERATPSTALICPAPTGHSSTPLKY